MYTYFFKRLLDFLVAFLGLLVFLPLVLVVAVALAFVNRGSPFFMQPRPGLNGKTFRIVKFKTMNDRRDAWGKLLPDAVRITRVGKWVRQSSLDEIPQLGEREPRCVWELGLPAVYFQCAHAVYACVQLRTQPHGKR